MQTVPRYFLRKADKLKSRKTIETLFATGKSFSLFPFKVVWMPMNNETVLQAGVGVSSRNFKKATDRNRIKRLMREAYRLQKEALKHELQQQGKTLSVFILYVGNELPEYGQVYEKTGNIIKRLIKLTHEAI